MVRLTVMAAWIAGIQIQDVSGDVHVNLDYSAACWNDEPNACHRPAECLSRTLFSKESRSTG
jgi:hypothetical protein